MENQQELKKSMSYWYDEIMKYDGELAQCEHLIKRMEQQLIALNRESGASLRAALREARVLADKVRTQRDLAIDEYDVLCNVKEAHDSIASRDYNRHDTSE